jgi:hypothetical protein
MPSVRVQVKRFEPDRPSAVVVTFVEAACTEDLCLRRALHDAARFLSGDCKRKGMPAEAYAVIIVPTGGIPILRSEAGQFDISPWDDILEVVPEEPGRNGAGPASK